MLDVANGESESFGGSFIESIKSNTVKNAIATAADQVFLPNIYVPQTQKYLDQSVSDAAIFNFVGDFSTAFIQTEDFKTNSTTATDDAKNTIDFAQASADNLGNFEKLTAIASFIPGLQTLRVVTKIIGGIKFFSYGTAAGTAGFRLYQIQEKEAPVGIGLAFDPFMISEAVSKQGGTESDYMYLPSPAYGTAYNDTLDGAIDLYLSQLEGLTELAQSSFRDENVALKMDSVTVADDELASALSLTQAHIFSKVDQALEEIEDFEEKYLQLGENISRLSIEQVLYYAQFIEYLGDDSYLADSLALQHGVIEEILRDISETVTEFSEELSEVEAVPYVFIRDSNVALDSSSEDGILSISALIHNISEVNVDSIDVTLSADSSVVYITPQEQFISTLSPREQLQLDWKIQVTDTSRAIQNYLIQLDTENAKTLSFNGNYDALTTITDTSVEDERLVPLTISLEQNYPNPFNVYTVIAFDVPEAEYVTLKVFDLLGREVTVLVEEVRSAGRHTITMYGTDFPSGTYFYRLTVGAHSETKSMTIRR